MATLCNVSHTSARFCSSNAGIRAFLPQIVPEEKLTKVNATNGTLQSLVLLVSPMFSGALLTITTIEVIFFIDVYYSTHCGFGIVFVFTCACSCESHGKPNAKLFIEEFFLLGNKC